MIKLATQPFCHRTLDDLELDKTTLVAFASHTSRLWALLSFPECQGSAGENELKIFSSGNDVSDV